ncbi:nuclear transport factor 2 family protein [Actinoallomurus sp. CA-150999]|uniref:nuclear transport factor 2 family protein n=1 Tax=Actinoallomurus sp. CA-150999 TaxID=3239887 RepID=UPI003D8EB29A
MTIEERLRRVESRLALQELAARYCLAIDDQDYDALTELFHAEAVMPIGGREVRGRTAVVAALREKREQNGGSVHTPDACILHELGEDHATGTVLAHVEMGVGDTTHFGALRYADRYVRQGGDWLFLRREMTVIHMGPWPEAGGSLTS